MIAFGKQLMGAATKMASTASKTPGVKRVTPFSRRAGKKITKAAIASKTGSSILARSPELKNALFQRKLLSTSSQAASRRTASQAAFKAKSAARSAPKPDFFPRLSQMGSGKKKAIGTAGLLGIGAASFASGVDSKNQVSNSVYDLAFNNPDYDKHVLGKKMGLRSLMAPLPGEMRMRGAMGMGTFIGQQPGSLLTSTTYADAWRASRKSSPRVDGSIAFGMYNARLG